MKTIAFLFVGLFYFIFFQTLLAMPLKKELLKKKSYTSFKNGLLLQKEKTPLSNKATNRMVEEKKEIEINKNTILVTE